MVTALIGLSLALQGWKSTFPIIDFPIPFDAAHKLVTTGAIPSYGHVTTYFSFAPPGTAWLLAPGMVLFSDPRLFEVAGAAVLYVAILVGVFFLARVCFGILGAWLAVLLVGISEPGLGYGATVWPTGHPVYYVWMAYLTHQWVVRRSANYLAMAIVIWAVGMYHFMTIAPAVLILVVAWVVYRPSVQLKPLLVAGVTIVVVWSPYLHFEAGRNFADLESQVFRRSLLPADFREVWCDPGVVLRERTDTPDASLKSGVADSPAVRPRASGVSRLWRRLLTRAGTAREGLLSNFAVASAVPGASVALMLAVLGGAIAMAVSGVHRRAIPSDRVGRWCLEVGVGMIVVAAFANELLIARFLSPDGFLEPSTVRRVRMGQAILASSGIVLLLGWTRKRLGVIIGRTADPELWSRTPETSAVLGLSLLVPWLFLLVAAEPGRPERFGWLWPLQVIVLSGIVTHAVAKVLTCRAIVLGIRLSVILLLLGTPLVSRGAAWLRAGWAGPEAEEVQVVRYVAERLRQEGRAHAAIGYHMFTLHDHPARWNVIDPRYKVGAELDLLFKYQHGISNTTRCAEGVSPDDEYRIVQTRAEGPWAANRHYFDVPLDESFRRLRRFDVYEVFGLASRAAGGHEPG